MQNHSEQLMSKGAFHEFVCSLAYHFGQDKYVTPGETTRLRLASWFEQVKHLPDSCLEYMADKVKKNNEFFPRNLSKAMLELWEQYLKDNPSKKARETREALGCSNCHWGWIVGWKKVEGWGWCSQAFKCSHCKTEQATRLGKWAYRHELMERGFILEPTERRQVPENTKWHGVVNRAREEAEIA